MNPTTAILMIGPPGAGQLAEMVAGARNAAAADSLEMLAGLPGIERIIVAHSRGAALDLAPTLKSNVLLEPDPDGTVFHFGRRLVELIARHQLANVLYLGAGSQPLLPVAELAACLDRLAVAPGPTVIANNLHSVDWAAFNSARHLEAAADWLDRDNMLAWRLRESAGYRAISLPPSAASRLDIDTPFDLQVLALHPQTSPHLRAFLARWEPRLHLQTLRRALEVLRTPGARVTMIGRVPAAAAELLGARQLWSRVFSEERGMVANRRQAEGRVFSLVADHIERAGEGEFVAQLARTSDLVLFDTRVYLAHHRLWPSDDERFAFDLGEVERLGDARLRGLTQALAGAPIPILLGGHNVVSGGLYALLEIAEHLE